MDPAIDLSEILTAIISLIRREVRMFSHIDPSRILICIGSSRNTGRGGGIYGKLLPLKFANGADCISWKGRVYSMPVILNKNIEQLYIIYFYMRRFFDLPPGDKLDVIFHELYHISPHFNGDIRRISSVKAAHGHSKEAFNSMYSAELRKFSALMEKNPLMNFLRLDAKALYAKFSQVKGMRMKRPSPILIDG